MIRRSEIKIEQAQGSWLKKNRDKGQVLKYIS
jgi:hypothetical protein